MKTLSYAGENYSALRERITDQYQKDMEMLELAKDNQLKELLKDYEKPEELTVKFVEVITKKSKLGHRKREIIESIFAPLVKRTAIEIINEKEKQPCDSKEPLPQTSQK